MSEIISNKGKKISCFDWDIKNRDKSKEEKLRKLKHDLKNEFNIEGNIEELHYYIKYIRDMYDFELGIGKYKMLSEHNDFFEKIILIVLSKGIKKEKKNKLIYFIHNYIELEIKKERRKISKKYEDIIKQINAIDYDIEYESSKALPDFEKRALDDINKDKENCRKTDIEKKRLIRKYTLKGIGKIDIDSGLYVPFPKESEEKGYLWEIFKKNNPNFTIKDFLEKGPWVKHIKAGIFGSDIFRILDPKGYKALNNWCYNQKGGKKISDFLDPKQARYQREVKNLADQDTINELHNDLARKRYILKTHGAS